MSLPWEVRILDLTSLLCPYQSDNSQPNCLTGTSLQGEVNILFALVFLKVDCADVSI
jgi:hypothetical protein